MCISASVRNTFGGVCSCVIYPSKFQTALMQFAAGLPEEIREPMTEWESQKITDHVKHVFSMVRVLLNEDNDAAKGRHTGSKQNVKAYNHALNYLLFIFVLL
jgi:hypothetical protein